MAVFLRMDSMLENSPVILQPAMFQQSLKPMIALKHLGSFGVLKPVDYFHAFRNEKQMPGIGKLCQRFFSLPPFHRQIDPRERDGYP